MFKWAIEKGLVGSFLIVCLYYIATFTARDSISTGLLFSLSPLIIILMLSIASNPYWGLVVIFVLNYFIMGISRYLPIGYLGISTDVMIVITLIAFMIRSAFKENVEWYRLKGNPLLKALLFWLLYCIVEVVNPSAVTAAWLSAIRPYALYPISIVIFTTLLFNKFKHLKLVLFLWSIFTLLAVIKVVIQYRFGFDGAELRWLGEGENARTHLLSTGIRYFSFFTDAGCFGASMGYSMVVFGIAAFAYKNPSLKLYYLLVAGAAMYAMFISGTRGALAVPLAGFALYTICTKNIRNMLIVGSFVLGSYLFLNYTTIGSGNSYITRMRTAFDENDASLILRKQNRATLAVYMKNKPFGEGLGLSGGEGSVYAPGRLTTSIANDSWFVKIWVESGPVGVTIHVALLLFFIGYGLYLILFRIKDKELRNLLAAILCGEAGLIISAWGNPIFVQYPNGILNYMIQAFVFMGLQFDKELEMTNALEEHEVRELV
jgi:hypothetical protein